MTHNARLANDPRYRMAFKQALNIRRSRRQAIKAAERVSAMLAQWRRDLRPGAVVLPLYRMTRDVPVR